MVQTFGNYKIGKKKKTHVKWTTEQKNCGIFSEKHIRNETLPKRTECETLKSQHSQILKTKDWLKIKVFIQNIYKNTKKSF